MMNTEQKTKVHAPGDRNDLEITRDFDIPVELLFMAYREPDIIQQWMGTRVLKFENRQHGGWEIETPDPTGKIAFRAHGVFHELIANKKMTRTCEMVDAPFGVQLEFLEFEKVSDTSSSLRIQIVYRSAEHRNRMLQLPFAAGLNMAHNRLQEIFKK